ncbi:hypothetical protein BVRB_5g120490 isoform B [Beta vulgaris subsp. vulgaris]|nr:hypothetical protein BVRB_5g120490 isoform B [Beta vulgaris subsp. vulgaris]
MVKFSKQGNSVGARVSETGGVDLVSDMAFDTCMMKTEEVSMNLLNLHTASMLPMW